MSDQTIDLPREGLYRALSAPDFEFRAAEDDGDDLGDEFIGLLRGHFLVFDQWTEIDSIFEGHFMERFAHGATKKTIREGRERLRPLFQHGRDPVAGDKPLGPIRDLREDDEGTYYEVPMLDTSYNRDLLPGLKAGLYGASHRFRVMREDIVEEPGVSDHNPKGLPERTIKEAQILEFGPVTFPAYEGATAGVRSITDAVVFGDFVRDPQRLRQLVELLTRNQETSPTDTSDHPVEDAAPSRNGAGQMAHPVRERRDSRPLYGLRTKEKPSWQL